MASAETTTIDLREFMIIMLPKSTFFPFDLRCLEIRFRRRLEDCNADDGIAPCHGADRTLNVVDESSCAG